ncbi:MAG: hypothetical protein HDT47_05310 [Ruminococcaceae bacterium]|nr:hypothetical protein [Oscillospiraceae bacterium]
MEKSKNMGLQDNTNAATKPNSSTSQGSCNKQKFALWTYPDTMEEVDKAYRGDNCKSKSEFIEKAIRFYLGYLKQEDNVNYLSPRITSSVDAVVHGSEQRINRNLFKIAVELGKLSHTIAAVNDVDENIMQELHEMCLDEVRHINGVINFEKAVKFQNEEEV